jgi:hypothetical protein
LQAFAKPRLILFFISKIFEWDGNKAIELSDELLSTIKICQIIFELAFHKIASKHLDK